MWSPKLDWESLTQPLGPVFGGIVGVVALILSVTLLIATILMPLVVWSIRGQVRALRRMAVARDEQQTQQTRELVDKLNLLIGHARAAVDELKPIRETLGGATVERVPE